MILGSIPEVFRIFPCFCQCHCRHLPFLFEAWNCLRLRQENYVFCEFVTLMKTCCTFPARPEVCQVRREVSLCPLGSKIGHKCKILSKLETFQRATQKCLVSSRNGHFMRRSLREDLKVFHESLSNLSGLSKHSQHAMLLPPITWERLPTTTQYWTFKHEPFVLQKKR